MSGPEGMIPNVWEIPSKIAGQSQLLVGFYTSSGISSHHVLIPRKLFSPLPRIFRHQATRYPRFLARVSAALRDGSNKACNKRRF